MQAFENALRNKGNPRHVVCLLTQVEVDPDDPAFKNPSKPIGYFYAEQEARVLHDELGWEMHEDSGRGWRYVVPSPYLRHVADISLVQAVAKSGAVVIAGGGGIPVVRGPKGQRRGIEAVIDKDRTSALMANVLGIDDLMILSPVSRVSINFGKANEQALDRVAWRDSPTPRRGAFLAWKHGTEDRGGDPVFGTRRPTRHDRAAG
jgi:carbamate kinase